jgi:hypothetical protein
MRATSLFVSFLLVSILAIGQTTYVWNGASPDWTDANNWTPPRSTPAANDILTFDASATNTSITNVPSQTIGKIIVTASSSYSLVSAASVFLTLTSLTGNALQIDNGSSLAIGNVSNAVNISLPSTGSAEIGGQLNLINGNLGAGNATLLIHTNSSPLIRTGGQVSLNANSTFLIGNAANQSGANIVLPNNIFVSSPTIASLTINRTNGATLGDQSITVTSTTTFTLGNLTTNGAGRIRFGTSAINPVESSNSYIIGFAEMLPRTIGTGAYDFLGFSMANGADVGTLSLVRRTGLSGTNTFNTNQSISSSWDVTNTTEPTGGRNLQFRWVDSFDNGTIPTNQFQAYRFNLGPGWTAVGPLQNLSATSPLRETASVLVNSMNDTFTVTDETRILPVELKGFFAAENDYGVQLTWSTASELNNESFTIQRSDNGERFEGLVVIKGSGTTKSESSYRWNDLSPRIGHNYYRLLQKDFDGKVSFSNVVYVWFDNGNGLKLFPNPTLDGSFNIKLSGDNGNEFLVTEVLSLTGERILVQANQFSQSGEVSVTPVNALRAGMYFVVMVVGNRKKVEKLIVK